MILNETFEYSQIINNPTVRDNLRYVFIMNYPNQEETIKIFSNLIGSFFELASNEIFPDINDIDKLKESVSKDINYDDLAKLTYETMQRSLSLKEIETTQYIVDFLKNDDLLMMSLKIIIDYGNFTKEKIIDRFWEEICHSLISYEQKYLNFGNEKYKYFNNFEDNKYLNLKDIITIILKRFDLV